jgi:uncharacterized membrane protein YqjE
MFHPTINDHSRRLVNSVVGKVENRLIEYGERLKEKKAELYEAF